MTNKQTSKIIPITRKQKEILNYLYKFRFLNTHQIQKLLNHKNPNRSLTWIKDLIGKKCIKRQYDRKSFQDNTKPATYYLGTQARHILKSENNLLIFFTKNELHDYEYFPNPLPDAFIAVKGTDSTKRYFLDLFDEYTPPFVIRQRVRSYLEYVENSDWDENTENTPLPSILFICPTESIKKHINLYAKSLFEKTYEDKLSLFLTTKTRINLGNKNNIWQKVTTD